MTFDLRVRSAGSVTYVAEGESTTDVLLPVCTPGPARESGRTLEARIVHHLAYTEADSPHLSRCHGMPGSTGRVPGLTSTATAEVRRWPLAGIAEPRSIDHLSFPHPNPSGEGDLPEQRLPDLFPVGETSHLKVVHIEAKSILDVDPPILSRGELEAHFASYYSLMAPDPPSGANPPA